VRIAEIKVKISWLGFRTDCVPTTVIDIGARLIKDWPCGDGIFHAGKSNLVTDCFMFESCPETSTCIVTHTMTSTIMTTVIRYLHMIWAKHVKVAKRQERITNNAFCPRRQRQMNDLLELSTRCSRLGAVMRVSIVIICLEIGSHVEGTGRCTHVLSRSETILQGGGLLITKDVIMLNSEEWAILKLLGFLRPITRMGHWLWMLLKGLMEVVK
jgi:hypothetical protein